jgi:hypothetical protein
VNLDFQSANLAILAYGESTVVESNDAFPGWHVYLGGGEQSTVLYNREPYLTPAISILGPNYYDNGSFQGFIASLQTYDPRSNGIRYVGLTQDGIVPLTAQSLRLSIFGDANEHFEITLNGTALSLIPIYATGEFTVFGADIVDFAGENVQLDLSLNAFTDSNNSVRLGFIEFSATPVPEPQTLVLLTTGLLALIASTKCWRVR